MARIRGLIAGQRVNKKGKESLACSANYILRPEMCLSIASVRSKLRKIAQGWPRELGATVMQQFTENPESRSYARHGLRSFSLVRLKC